MSNLSKELSIEDIQKIADKDDFHISVLRPDGKSYGTLTWIWVVLVDNTLFVRAYNGIKSRWYNAALQQRIGCIEAAGMKKQVHFEPVSGDINNRIDEAYRKKYSSSPYLNSMISERATAATIKITFGI